MAMLSLVLMVNDCALSRDFYTRTLGFSAAGLSLCGPDGDEVFASVTRDGVTILLDATEPETAAAHDRGKGVALHLALQAEADLNNLYDRVRAANVPLMLEATGRSTGDRMFAITDPDGYTITITRAVTAAGSNPSAA